MKIGALVALGLDGYYSKLPKGSTVAAVTSDPGPSCTDAPRLVAEGMYHMAISTPAWYPQMAGEGRGLFSEPLPLKALAAFPHNDRLVMAVREETGIMSLQEIIDRRTPLKVSTTLPESRHPAGLVADLVLQAYGGSLADIEKWGGEILKDRPRNQNNPSTPPVDPKFDAIFDEAIMTRRWKRIFETYRMRVLPIDDSVLDQFVGRGFRRGVLEAGRWGVLTEDVPTLDFSGWVLFCHADLPDEVAYLTIRGLDEQHHAIEALFDEYSGLTGPIDMSQACQNTGLPLHPGAEAYYREHGYLAAAADGSATHRPVPVG
jgi:TRAP-type uncharacterized transport system substrate-binding protein